METLENGLVLLADDYKLLISYLHGQYDNSAFDRTNAAELQSELKKARIVQKEEFPADVVRLNSTVRIRAEDSNHEKEFTLVTPDRADIRKKQISIMAPLGTALLGFRKGQKVKWRVPAGEKTFVILEVSNPPE